MFTGDQLLLAGSATFLFAALLVYSRARWWRRWPEGYVLFGIMGIFTAIKVLLFFDLDRVAHLMMFVQGLFVLLFVLIVQHKGVKLNEHGNQPPAARNYP